MNLDKIQAIELARSFLISQGIEILELELARRIDGAVRAEYHPEKKDDFWIIRFARIPPSLDASEKFSEEEQDILEGLFADITNASVIVELDGSIEII